MKQTVNEYFEKLKRKVIFMKRFLLICAGIWLFMFILPIFAVKGDLLYSPKENASLPAGTDAQTKITLWNGEKVEELSLDVYLQGVIAGEMPASFPQEALKAQAVAARTHTMNRASKTPDKSHNGAMVCSNPAHCKAYKPLDIAAAGWGMKKGTYTQKIINAVADTDGQILIYDGQPITAVFHSTSSGKTERAADVWGSDVPYLQSVESSGEQDAPKYYGRVEMSAQEFRDKFMQEHPNANLSGLPDSWFKNSTRSQAGGVINVYVGGVKVTGNQIRSLCGLRSTNFTVKVQDGKLIFDTLGYGHGVGMSQYGARAMADSGKNYREILSWYYKGVEFGQIQATNGGK